MHFFGVYTESQIVKYKTSYDFKTVSWNETFQLQLLFYSFILIFFYSFQGCTFKVFFIVFVSGLSIFETNLDSKTCTSSGVYLLRGQIINGFQVALVILLITVSKVCFCSLILNLLAHVMLCVFYMWQVKNIQTFVWKCKLKRS